VRRQHREAESKACTKLSVEARCVQPSLRHTLTESDPAQLTRCTTIWWATASANQVLFWTPARTSHDYPWDMGYPRNSVM